VVRSQTLLKDLRWLGRKHERLLLKEALRRLEQDPLASTRNMKDLRPNPVAQRELRLFGQYRLFFNVDPADHAVTLVRAGRKRGSRLFMRGETARLSYQLA
jgi:mRNA-degrading endonuclease RelE of RelBE toxin-antitoxin system